MIGCLVVLLFCCLVDWYCLPDSPLSLSCNPRDFVPGYSRYARYWLPAKSTNKELYNKSNKQLYNKTNKQLYNYTTIQQD